MNSPKSSKENWRDPHLGEPAGRPVRPAQAWFRAARMRVNQGLSAFDAAYLPFASFEDCNIGNPKKREAAFARNKERKHLILPHLRAWTLRAIAMGAALWTAENAQRLGVDTMILQAPFALGFVACVVVCAVMWVGWLGLTFFKN